MELKKDMRILWVKPGGLWPVNTGGRLRSFNIISELSRRNQVSVITTQRPEDDSSALADNLPLCRSVTSLEYSAPKRSSLEFAATLFKSWLSEMPVDLYKFQIAKLRQEVASALASGEFDLCIADFLVALPNIPFDAPMQPGQNRVPVIYFSHNVEHMIWKRLCRNDKNPLRRLILEIEWRKMRSYEANACKRVALTIAVSEEDRDQLSMMAPGSNSCAVPTGVDIEYFRPTQIAAQNPFGLVFTGSMDWHPNEDSIVYFIDSILPHIQKRLPAVTLTVAGRNPSPLLQSVAARVGVRLTGTVDDIRPFIQQAAVYVVPLRIGGGTRLKIFEALAMGKAIVSTTIGAEGLPLIEGQHVLRADEPVKFAEQVVQLLEDKQQREELGKAGRKLVEESYSWATVAAEFEAQCRTALPVNALTASASEKLSISH
jgi:glycosyltransferase involved in cell wall biosynthesis